VTCEIATSARGIFSSRVVTLGTPFTRAETVFASKTYFAGFGETLQDIGYAGRSMLEIVADPPVEQIVTSHRKLAKWGWALLHG